MLDELRNAERVLAVRLDNIGDVVMLSPALRSLKAAMPQASLTLMASPVGAQVAPMIDAVDDVLQLRATWQDASGNLPFDPRRELSLMENIAGRHFDAAFLFTSFSQSPFPLAYLCYLAGVPVRVGQSKEFGGSVLSHSITPPDDAAHQVERNLHLLRSVGIPTFEDDLKLDLEDNTMAVAKGLLTANGVRGPYIVLAPGASCRARTYAAERYRLVAERLMAETEMSVVLIGTQSEAAGVLQQRTPDGLISLGGQTTVSEMAAVIARASLVVCNNSAPMHIAEAFGRPIVVLFSGTDMESQWRPRRAPFRILREPTSCTPCYGFSCPYDMECLDIPPSVVVESCVDLITNSGRTPLARNPIDPPFDEERNKDATTSGSHLACPR